MQGPSLLGMWPRMCTFCPFFSDSNSWSPSHCSMLAGSVLLINNHLDREEGEREEREREERESERKERERGYKVYD